MIKKDFDQVLSIMVQSFHPTGFYKYIEPDHVKRTTFLKGLFYHRIIQATEYGEIDVALQNDVVVGSASWFPPKRTIEMREKPSQDLAYFFANLTHDVQDKLNYFISIMLDAMLSHTTPPYWILAPVVVMNNIQKHGIATNLITHKLKKINLENCACVLATQDEKNSFFYHHFGFEVLSQDSITGSTLINYTMVRESVR
jgi:hypothetical protein